MAYLEQTNKHLLSDIAQRKEFAIYVYIDEKKKKKKK